MKKISVAQTASKGYAYGPVYVVQRQEINVSRRNIAAEEIGEEIEGYRRAVRKAKEQLSVLAEDSEIFEAYLQLIGDEALEAGVTEKIQNGLCAEAALSDAVREFEAVFESMDDPYMKERAADLRDVEKRLLYALLDIEINPFQHMARPSVIVADELTPSDTADMDMDKVLGFLTEKGGVTSHVSIIARGRGIPCLTGVKNICSLAENGMTAAVDAGRGEVYLEPDEAVEAVFAERRKIEEERRKIVEAEGKKPSVTKDGHSFMICANVGNIQDIREAMNSPAEGVGLFRSEFVYMMKKDSFPSEEEQFEIYKEAAGLVGGRELTIRTLDIGGDKRLDYFRQEKEENPFLGCRAVRLCLNMPDVFKTQLRALLRASAYGNIRIMYPMLIAIEELEKANRILEECKRELVSEGRSFNRDIEVGIMIETPAAVMMADEFAKRVDFFSIGTNDLTQYMLAVDRGNETVSELYDPFHPAVLRAVQYVIDRAHAHGIKAGMCGEFAGDSRAAEILLGMGLDEFSMSVGIAGEAKCLLRSLNYEEAVVAAKQVLGMESALEIRKFIGKKGE